MNSLKYLMLVALSFAMIFRNAEADFFTKGTVRTVTYNENGDQVIHQREMTPEETSNLDRTLNQAKDQILGVGQEVKRALFENTQKVGDIRSLGDLKGQWHSAGQEMRRSFEAGAAKMKAAAADMRKKFETPFAI
uniref:Uncharacterized protein n=1 Tax=Megaselia scalaris TaxID=36166 RepID=T1GNA6_MEGSC